MIGMSQIAGTERNAEQKEIRTGCAADLDNVLMVTGSFREFIEVMIQLRKSQMEVRFIGIGTDECTLHALDGFSGPTAATNVNLAPKRHDLIGYEGAYRCISW